MWVLGGERKAFSLEVFDTAIGSVERHFNTRVIAQVLNFIPRFCTSDCDEWKDGGEINLHDV